MQAPTSVSAAFNGRLPEADGARHQPVPAATPHLRRSGWRHAAASSTHLIADEESSARQVAAPSTAPATQPAQIFKDKTGKVYPSFDQLAQLTGDPKSGAAVFRNAQGANCIRCHQIGDEGGMVGPPLTSIGDKLSKSQLYESIFLPSASILMGYEDWLVKTKDGDLQEGLLVEQTNDRITLKDVTGQYHDIPKDQIVSKKQQAISIMPEGLPATMTEKEMVDLVQYLTTLKNPQ